MARTARTKRVAILPPSTQAEADQLLSDYARADARKKKINAQMDEQFTKIREKYTSELAEIEEVTKSNFEKLQMWYESNRDIFGRKKSVETSHGLIGFRTGTPKLKTRRGFTWAAVLELLKGNDATAYIRVKEEPAKALFLENRDREHCQELMAKVGIEVTQDETFFVELKKEETND